MKLSLHDKSVLYHELAKLVKSGFGFDKSANLLLEQAPTRAQAAFAQEVLRRLGAGQSIAASIDQPQLGIEPLERAVVEAAERGGVLESAFSDLRDHFSAALRIRRRIAARLIYPLLLLHLAAFLPALPPLLLDQGVGQPLRDSLLFLAILYAVALFLRQAGFLLHSRAPFSLAIDRFLRRLPLLGKARQLAALQRFTGIFRVSLLAAHRVSDGLLAAGSASGSAVLRHTAQRLASHAEQGGALGQLLPEMCDLPPALRRSLASAEIAGQLEPDLHSWQMSYREELETQWLRIATILPMILTTTVALFVAWRIVTLYSGILQNQLKGLEVFW